MNRNVSPTGYMVLSIALILAFEPCAVTQEEAAPSAAGQYQVLYTFQGRADGAFPREIIRDAAGNLYGTAYEGGNTISNNSALIGGAICNGGMLTIMDSTCSGNVARQHEGGAIANYGTLTITNSTFSGNIARRSLLGSLGGGILNGGLFQSTGTLAINNSTLSGNVARGGKGGAIFNVKGSTVVLQNSIVANNTGGNGHGAVTSNGYNLSSDNTCDFDSAGDLNDLDPKLGHLRNNSGPTKTLALLPGSPAIDSGNPRGCTDGKGHLLKTDQRGKPRPDKEDESGCDRGAYERQKD